MYCVRISPKKGRLICQLNFIMLFVKLLKWLRSLFKLKFSPIFLFKKNKNKKTKLIPFYVILFIFFLFCFIVLIENALFHSMCFRSLRFILFILILTLSKCIAHTHNFIYLSHLTFLFSLNRPKANTSIKWSFTIHKVDEGIWL